MCQGDNIIICLNNNIYGWFRANSLNNFIAQCLHHQEDRSLYKYLRHTWSISCRILFYNHKIWWTIPVLVHILHIHNISSAVIDCLALYNFSRNSSPTLAISSALTLLCLNTSSMFQSPLPNTPIAFFLPMLYISDIVSHPVMACAFKICCQVCGTIFCWMLFIL